MASTAFRGVHTLEDLRLRCVIDDETGCWRWSMATDRNGRPFLWVPARHRCLGIGAALIALGVPCPKKQQLGRTCDELRCANPEHHRPMTRGELVRLGNQRNRAAVIVSRQRAAETRTGRAGLTSDEVAAIRASKASARDAAKQFGVSCSTVHRIRNGERRSGVVPGATVFNWRPAAPEQRRPAGPARA